MLQSYTFYANKQKNANLILLISAKKGVLRVLVWVIYLPQPALRAPLPLMGGECHADCVPMVALACARRSRDEHGNALVCAHSRLHSYTNRHKPLVISGLRRLSDTLRLH